MMLMCCFVEIITFGYKKLKGVSCNCILIKEFNVAMILSRLTHLYKHYPRLYKTDRDRAMVGPIFCTVVHKLLIIMAKQITSL